MAGNGLVDAGFVVALLSRRDTHHRWAVAQAARLPPPWIAPVFDLDANVDAVVKFIQKYHDVPASLADACLVRLTETLADPVLLTTDSDFRIYRRHGRLTVPCVTP